MSKQDFRTDLTQHSDEELSLVVMNDEVLYRSRHRRGFIELLDECFIFTDAQLDVLKQDLEDELIEESQNETGEC